MYAARGSGTGAERVAIDTLWQRRRRRRSRAIQLLRSRSTFDEFAYHVLASGPEGLRKRFHWEECKVERLVPRIGYA